MPLRGGQEIDTNAVPKPQKGRSKTAQGNALGSRPSRIASPERAIHKVATLMNRDLGSGAVKQSGMGQGNGECGVAPQRGYALQIGIPPFPVGIGAQRQSLSDP